MAPKGWATRRAPVFTLRVTALTNAVSQICRAHEFGMLRGNPAGRERGSRNRLSEEVICALLRDFRQHGQKAVARVRQTQPAAYLKILALLVPREHKVEHRNLIKELSDEQLEAMVEYLETSLEAQSRGSVRVIEGTIEPISAEVQRGPLLDSPNPRTE